MGISRILGCLLGCHILFIPFSLPVNALTAYDSAANLSSSWINNGSRDIGVDSEDYSTLRPIFLGQGINASFACGFYCNYNCEGYLFAILIFPPPGKYNYPEVRNPKVVWSANQNFLVRDDATLQLTQDGDLILRDADGTLVWCTYTYGKSVVGLNLTETGNLVLFDSNNASVWQSFDHPTDSLVPGQILVLGQKLIATVSNKDWSQGLISLVVTEYGVAARIESNPPQNYFALRLYNSSNTEPRYLIFKNEGLFFLPDTALFEIDNSFSAQYMKLEPKGHLTFYGFVNDIWKVLFNPLLGELNCAYPMICGKYGVCSKQQCFCPGPTAGETRYFTPVNDEEPDLGCKEITPLSCNASHYQSLLMLRSTTSALILQLNKTEIGNETESDIESCKQACLSNFSCKAAVFLSGVENGGACYLLSEIFSLMKDARLQGWTTFIKVQNISNPGEPPSSSNPEGPPSSSNPEGPPSSSNPEGPQSSSSPETIIRQLLSTLGAFVGLVFIVIIIGRYLILKGKDVKEDGEDKDLLQVPGMPTRFSHEILVAATENFSRELGKGGFGSVFEGILTDGTKVAVKCINGLSQTKDYFLAEVETIGGIHHLNLVRLVGYCANKSNRCLVYEYMFNGSLDKWIFHRNKELALDWQTRRKIILDIAKGLSYLHEECRQKIIHLDIKPQNILLDESFNAKVSDFGLSKLMDRDQSQVVTTLRGTPGYMAPEWLISAITEKVDVYSFGIVTLEILCGRRNLDHSQPEEDKYLLSLFKRKAEEDQMLDLVDKYSEDMQLHGEEAVELMMLAAWCLQNDNGRRPSMSMVIKVVEGVIDVEDNLDYNFLNSSGLGATEAVHRREINVGFASPVNCIKKV
uniref:Receptor-like serine/threonine-protein kinase n=1 Tax=Vitis vinifera TaxID=29760 RepID=F6H558_VITVI